MSLDDRVRQGDTTRILDSAVEKHCEGLIVKEQVLAPPHTYYLNKKLEWTEPKCPQHYNISKNYEGQK